MDSSEAQEASAERSEHRPKIVIVHKFFCALMCAIGVLFVGIGLSLLGARGSIAQSYSRGPGSQTVVSWSSSEQGRAPFYVAAGLLYAALYAVGLGLPRRRGAYTYLTVLLALGCWNVIGVAYVGIMSIWWFRRGTREYFRMPSQPTPVEMRGYS